MGMIASSVPEDDGKGPVGSRAHGGGVGDTGNVQGCGAGWRRLRGEQGDDGHQGSERHKVLEHGLFVHEEIHIN